MGTHTFSKVTQTLVGSGRGESSPSPAHTQAPAPHLPPPGKETAPAGHSWLLPLPCLGGDHSVAHAPRLGVAPEPHRYTPHKRPCTSSSLHEEVMRRRMQRGPSTHHMSQSPHAPHTTTQGSVKLDRC